MKRKNKLLLGTLILTGLMVLYATVESATPEDAFYTISGKVKDSSTGKSVAFASITVSGMHIGTVANLDGEFSLKIPISHEVAEITISHIGYRCAGFRVDEIEGTMKEFLIEPHSIILQEVVIRPTDARSLVTSALGRINENYPVIPYRLTGFYRETVRQRRDYISVSEAVVDIYQAPYNSVRDRDMFSIIRGRKSGDVKKADTLLVKLQGGPHVSMLLDVVKNRSLLISEETVGLYNFEMVDIVKIDDVSNYVISFKPREDLGFPHYFGKLYISADRHAITMAEFSLDLNDKEKAAQSFILKKPARLRFNPVNTRYLVSYKKIDGKYQVNYLRYELEFFADWRRRIFRTGYTIISEMAVTSRSSENVTRIPLGKAFRNSAVLADQVPVYFDDDFWGDYNYIEPDQSIEAAIRRLNRRLEW